ncbi:MAG: hypothetical protein RIR00_1722 [Pseudomonadota bacterium]|jgi:uncharacterized protein
MKLHPPKTDGLHIFTAHGAGFVDVDRVRYHGPLLVLPDRLISDWTPRPFEALTPADFQLLADQAPEILLFGSGSRQRFPAVPLLQPLIAAGIGLEVMNTPAACRTYNILASEGRKVAAAILID